MDPNSAKQLFTNQDLKGDRQESNFLFCITEIFNLNKYSAKEINLIDKF